MRCFTERIFAYDVFTMRKIIDYILFGFTFLLTLSACGKVEIESSIDQPLYPEATVGEVRLVLPDGATRAHFEPNEGNTRATVTNDGRFLWQSGDRFRLYAHNSDGSNAFPADSYIDFSYWINTTSAGRSFFRGTITEDMSDGSYTYYAVYPHSTPVEGTTATFTLPATQSGEYSRYDFMVASSTAANSATASGNALQAIQDNDPNTPEPMNDIALSFKHKLHALRFEIPSQGVLTSGIRRVHILFSEAVVGDVVVNMATDEVSYTNMTNKITVDFGAGKEKHSGDVFWVMTLPQTSFSRAVDIRFEDSNGNFTTRQLVTFPSSQQYTAGRLTPIKINVPSSLTGVTSLHYNIRSHKKLGEPITNLHLTLPVGYYFTDYTSYRNSVANSSGEYVYSIFNDLFDNTLRNADLKLDYESNNAFIPTTVKLENTVNVGGRTDYPLETPYLFEETFSEVSQFDYKMGITGLNIITAKSLAEYGLDDWYGARVGSNGGGENGAMAITVRHETTAQYRGRLDSSGFSHLKEGKSVNISVSFRANRSSKWAYLDFGIGLVSDGALTGGDGISGSSVRVDPTTNSNITYANIDKTDYTYTFNTVSSNNRLSWVLSRDYVYGDPWDSEDEQNGWYSRTWYVYMDDIRVSIAP